MQPQAILFDLDGTLVDSLGDLTASVSHARSRFGLSEVTIDDVRLMVGDGAEKLVRRALEHREELVTPGLDAFRDHYAVHFLDRTQLFPGVKDMLEQLHEIPLAVISNKPESFCRDILAGLDVEEHFATVVGGETFAERKPSPLPLTKVLEQLGADPASSYMVGDGPQDLRAGRAAGVITCAVTWGLCSRADLEAEQPDHLVDHVAELLSILLG